MKMKIKELKYLNIDDYGRIWVHATPADCFNHAKDHESAYWAIAKPYTIETIVDVDMPKGLVTL